MLNEWFDEGIMCQSTMESGCIVTDYFFSKLSAQSQREFHELALQTPAISSHFEKPLQIQNRLPEAQRRRDTLYFGNHYLPETFNRETGLFDFNPPDDVHAMVRGQAYCGDLYYADLIAEALARIDKTFLSGGCYLDFGCSSGRVVMPLAVAYQDAFFYGCDPLFSAVKWAQENIKRVNFTHSQQTPPLPYQDKQFDMVYAISIWSHFSEHAARSWLSEMQRIIKPGGHLLITSHGFGSLKYFRNNKAMAIADIDYCWQALLSKGYCFFDVYADDADWGLESSDWGQSFISPMFVLVQLMDQWSLVWFASRRAEDNQDVYLFEKH